VASTADLQWDGVVAGWTLPAPPSGGRVASLARAP
jgi:hypothetical protein